MSDKRKAILLRISPDLSEALQRWAKDELRSVNAQIEYVLREATRRREGGRRPPGDIADEEPPSLFAQVSPWVKGLIEGLRDDGLAEWAQRMEAAVNHVGPPGEILMLIQETLTEMRESGAVLPESMRYIARGLERLLLKQEE